MKAILILILSFGIQISGLFAGNIGKMDSPTSPTELFCPECPILIPKVPLEAPFNELTEFDITLNLMPLIPLEAPFDEDIEAELTASTFAPVLPLQADFDDDEINPVYDDGTLAPVMPVSAEFHDTL